MGRYRNGRWLSALSWATAGVLIVLTVLMLWFTLH
jgi:Mn2+/Fe2+ NRAMP family transporter